MVSKWRLVGLDDYVVGEDNKIYRLKGSWWTRQQLRSKLIKDHNPVTIFENISDCPF